MGFGHHRKKEFRANRLEAESVSSHPSFDENSFRNSFQK